MVLVEREPQETDKEGTMESAAASSEPSTRETGTVPRPRRFLTRSSAARRKQQEAILLAALGSMELDLVADNIPSHEALLRQLLSALEQDHMEFMVKEGLNPNAEPEKSYMLEYERKVDRAVNKHKKLGQTASYNATKTQTQTWWPSGGWKKTCQTRWRWEGQCQKLDQTRLQCQ